MKSTLIGMLMLVMALPALSQERILKFDSAIEVQPDGVLAVTETIRVKAEGSEIKRGIYRDFPQIYKGKWGLKEKRSFDVESVTRDGKPETFRVEQMGVGSRVWIGNPDGWLKPGEYTYQIRYRTDRQLILGKTGDELYWNVTGNYWTFPIEEATAQVVLPSGVVPKSVGCWIGEAGSKERGRYDSEAANPVSFAAGRWLQKGEGMTVSVIFPPGLLHADAYKNRSSVWRDNPMVVLAGLLFLAMLVYDIVAWVRVGKDPAKGVIFPRYGPPAGFSPAAVRCLWRMGFDNKCFSAGVLGLAVKKWLAISQVGNYYSVEGLEGGEPRDYDEAALSKALAPPGSHVMLVQANHDRIGGARKQLQWALSAKLEKTHFVKNLGWWVPGLLLGLGAVLLMLLASGAKEKAFAMFWWMSIWSVGTMVLVSRTIAGWRGGGLAAVLRPAMLSLLLVAGWIVGAGQFLAGAGLLSGICFFATIGMASIFYHLIKAPTHMGRKIMDEIEGFRHYLGVAEKDRLNMMNSPEETPELFETFLPYALALDVEEKWSQRFAAVLAAAGTADSQGGYSPSFYSGTHTGMDGAMAAADLGGKLTGALASSTSAPPSSSSSSSSGGGGGSSGGGGGGGGGGGW